MKTQKHAWALAALLAASGAAWAQSSVTLYGVVDVGFGKMHGRKVGMMTSEAVNHTTSHIGFKGVEDLGGGLKTGFRLEQAINLKNGETAFLRAKTACERAANLWQEGGFGQFRMGRAKTPSYNAMLT